MILIQKATPEQADTLSQIAVAAKAHWGYPKRWMDMWKPQLTFSPEYFEQYEGWVAIDEKKPIGFYTLEQRGENAWLENLWVLPDYIGKGIGKLLFLHSVERARQRGYKRLQLEADPHAVGFYEKMGMYKVSQRRYEMEGQPRILPTMEMEL